MLKKQDCRLQFKIKPSCSQTGIDLRLPGDQTGAYTTDVLRHYNKLHNLTSVGEHNLPITVVLPVTNTLNSFIHTNLT